MLRPLEPHRKGSGIRMTSETANRPSPPVLRANFRFQKVCVGVPSFLQSASGAALQEAVGQGKSVKTSERHRLRVDSSRFFAAVLHDAPDRKQR